MGCAALARATGGVLLTLAALSAGGLAAAQPAPSLFAYDGHAWRALSEGEKLALLTGFLLGGALEQGAAVAADPGALAPEALDTLRKERRLRFPFAPNVYKARLEDFYHYQDRLPIPLYRALFLINEHILESGR
jgi:hypothetical protein